MHKLTLPHENVKLSTVYESLDEFKSFVIDTKSNTKNITKSTSIHSDYLGVPFVLLIHQYGIFGREICYELQKPTRMLLILFGITFCK